MKSSLMSVVKKARENFMTEDDAKKLADSFEEEASTKLERYLSEHPNAAFSTTFAFLIDFSHIDVLNHKCNIDVVDVWSTIHHYEAFDPTEEVPYPNKEEADLLHDGLKTRALVKFFTELKNRGYSVGYDEDTDPSIVIYFTAC